MLGQNLVKQLTDSDFALDSKELISLKSDDCTLALFYTENPESTELSKIWVEAASQVVGPVFASVNMLNKDSAKIAKAFTTLASQGSNPLHWASMKALPFIMVYRGGWPVAFYNGDRAIQPIIDYSLTLACKANYYEPIQIARGARVTKGAPSVISNEPKSVSIDFKLAPQVPNLYRGAVSGIPILQPAKK